MAAQLDTIYRVETPENIDLQAECAGPGSRCLAYLTDLGIRLVVMFIAGLVAMFMGRTGTGLYLLCWFLLDWLYPVLFEVLWNGQTPGKRVMGLRVLHLDLSPVGWNASLIRNLLRTVDFLPGAYFLGLCAMCLTRHYQRLGDLAAGTIVVYQNDVPANAGLPDVSAVSPPVSLDLDEQVALMNFARRDAQLSDSRKQELAGILAPLGGPEAEDEAVRYWQGVGTYLTGTR